MLCNNGMHASERVLDALKYAPGPIFCEVELGGEILKMDDKVCAENRTAVSMRDITPILQEWSLSQAKAGIIYSRVIDKRSSKGIKIKRKWLVGEATDKELTRASIDSWEAVRDSAALARKARSWEQAQAWEINNACRIAAENTSKRAAWIIAREVANALILWESDWERWANYSLMEMLCTTTS